MGILISRFRKKPSTKELLENIDKELDDIEDFKFYTQQQQKRLIGSLIIYSIVTYIIAALVFYFYYFPSELSKQILYSLPLIAFPVIVWIIKQLLHWYFRYKLSQNEDQIILLLRERKKLLKEVMEKETYKVAKEILEKYDPDQIQKKMNIFSTRPSNAPEILAKLPEMELRKRAAMVAAVKALPKVPVRPLGSQLLPSVRPMPAPIKPGYNAPPSKPGFDKPPSSVPRPPSIRPSGIRMPCPILPQQRGVFDKMVEYVVGDGPSNRYALICRQCQSHNGMALREEYEFTAFRCCYCYSFNPSRKQRPMAPRLSLPSFIQPPNPNSEEKSSSSDESSGSESPDKLEASNQESETPQASDANKTEDNTSEMTSLGEKDDIVPPSDDMVAGLTIPATTTERGDTDSLEISASESVPEEMLSNTAVDLVPESHSDITEPATLEESVGVATIPKSENTSFEFIGYKDDDLLFVDEASPDSPS